ncbi:MAG: sigma 54-interacting transcriptional regulator [Deltaproteobacteria bacterium]|nr:sigma 54-interacting transcriptional regulator [Deltaproteobacteria bacterium]
MVTGLRIELVIRDAGGPPVQRSFTAAVLQVGRGLGNDVPLADPRVSSIHGRLLLDAGAVRYQDLGSTNGSALIRQGERSAVPAGESGVLLGPGDEIQLGDADEPSCIRLVALEAASVPSPRVTIVAGRALGQMAGPPDSEVFRRLLQLLASLRCESDRLELTRQVLSFLADSLPGVSRAECSMRDGSGRFSPVLVLGPDRDAPGAAPSSSLIERMIASRETLLIEDMETAADASASMRSMPVRSLLLAPLIQDEAVVGALQIGSAQGGRFGERELDLVSVLAAQISALLSGAALIRRLQEAEARLRGQCDYLISRLGQEPALEQMRGRSQAIQRVRSQIEAVAASRTTVLIEGETGTGKELAARALHELSPRAGAAFAAVNCSSLASGVLESELFGHVKGAFTGAHRDRKGLFEVAHGGTLLLDEIGDMPAELQPKLLRALEEGQVLPVGASRPRLVDVRVIAATHRDLDAEVAAGRFRQDLLFRLNVFSLRLPPLRERGEDIQLLAEHFLERFSREHGREQAQLTAEALAALEAYTWPGNIRELRNEMERASLLRPPGEPVSPAQLSARLGGETGAQSDEPQLRGSLKEVMERLEKTVVARALERHGGNRTRCAKELGISRQALVAKIARHGLD